MFIKELYYEIEKHFSESKSRNPYLVRNGKGQIQSGVKEPDHSVEKLQKLVAQVLRPPPDFKKPIRIG